MFYLLYYTEDIDLKRFILIHRHYFIYQHM